METPNFGANGTRGPGGIRVTFANVRSIRSKIDDLSQLIKASYPDLIALAETWLSSDILDSEISIPGYSLARADRLGNRLGEE